MRFRKTLIFLILPTGLACALPARAQPRDVAPTLRSAFCSGGVPTAGRRSETAATMANASACAAMLPALPAGAEQKPKPFTQEQVVSMVRDGFGDDSGAKLIEQRGIDFAPSEDFYQTLKAAGASEAFLKVLRAAKPPEPASAKKPLNQVQVFALLVGQVPSHRVAMLVEQRGIDFEPTDDYLQEVRLAGGENELISALKSAKVTKPTTVDPAAQARQAEIRQHMARGAEFLQKRQFAQAELECRAALLLDSQNADLNVSLSYVLLQQRKWDDAAAAAREAIHLNPNNDMAHNNLGVALGGKGDWAGQITEEREALRLNPNNDMAHHNLGLALGRTNDWASTITEEREALRLNPNNDMAHAGLGVALGKAGDRDGEITEEREALRLNPNNGDAHVNLGVAFGSKGDRGGEIAEYHEALRLDPNNDVAHNNLGVALGKTGDWDAAITEEREALRLNPTNDDAHNNLGLALKNKGDLDSSIAEYGEALRLNPTNDKAHVNLGLALANRGDWAGMITEEREALRLNPNNALAHAGLGLGLEKNGDRQGALEEYRAACTLDPTNVTYKQNYERVMQPLSQPVQKGVQRLQDVRRIYVGSFGNEDGAEVIKNKVITRLVKTGRFEVVQSAEQADAILTGASEISRSERYSANGSGGTHYHATAGIQLINKNQNILWADDTSSGGFSRSASSSLADRIVNDLLKAIAKEVKPK